MSDTLIPNAVFQFVCSPPVIPNKPVANQTLNVLSDTLENATAKIRTAQPTWIIRSVNQLVTIDLQ